MNKEFERFNLEASSDLDYEKMVINLNFGNETIAILNCDNGDDKAEIRILDSNSSKVIWTFDCQAFIKALNRSSESLKEINKKLVD